MANKVNNKLNINEKVIERLIKESEHRILNEHEILKLIAYTEQVKLNEAGLKDFLKNIGRTTRERIEDLTGFTSNPLALRNFRAPKLAYTSPSDEEVLDQNPELMFRFSPKKTTTPKRLRGRKPISARTARRAEEHRAGKNAIRQQKADDNFRADIDAARTRMDDSNFLTGKGYSVAPPTALQKATSAVSSTVNSAAQKASTAASNVFDDLGRKAYVYGLPKVNSAIQAATGKAKEYGGKALGTIGKKIRSVGRELFIEPYKKVMSDPGVQISPNGLRYSGSTTVYDKGVKKTVSESINDQLNEASFLLGGLAAGLGAKAYTSYKNYLDQQQQMANASDQYPAVSSEEEKYLQMANSIQEKYGIDPLGDPKEAGKLLYITRQDPELDFWKTEIMKDFREKRASEPADSVDNRIINSIFSDMKKRQIPFPDTPKYTPKQTANVKSFDYELTPDDFIVDAKGNRSLKQDVYTKLYQTYGNGPIRDPFTGKITTVGELVQSTRDKLERNDQRAKEEKAAEADFNREKALYQRMDPSSRDQDIKNDTLNAYINNLGKGLFGRTIGRIFGKDPWTLGDDRTRQSILATLINQNFLNPSIKKNLDLNSPRTRALIVDALKKYRDSYDSKNLISMGVGANGNELKITPEGLNTLRSSGKISDEIYNYIVKANNALKTAKPEYRDLLLNGINAQVSNTGIFKYLSDPSNFIYKPKYGTPLKGRPAKVKPISFPDSQPISDRQRRKAAFRAAQAHPQKKAGSIDMQTYFGNPNDINVEAFYQKPILSYFEEAFIIECLNNRNKLLLSESANLSSDQNSAQSGQTSGINLGSLRKKRNEILTAMQAQQQMSAQKPLNPVMAWAADRYGKFKNNMGMARAAANYTQNEAELGVLPIKEKFLKFQTRDNYIQMVQAYKRAGLPLMFTPDQQRVFKNYSSENPHNRLMAQQSDELQQQWAMRNMPEMFQGQDASEEIPQPGVQNSTETGAQATSTTATVASKPKDKGFQNVNIGGNMSQLLHKISNFKNTTPEQREALNAKYSLDGTNVLTVKVPDPNDNTKTITKTVNLNDPRFKGKQIKYDYNKNVIFVTDTQGKRYPIEDYSVQPAATPSKIGATTVSTDIAQSEPTKTTTEPKATPASEEIPQPQSAPKPQQTTASQAKINDLTKFMQSDPAAQAKRLDRQYTLTDENGNITVHVNKNTNPTDIIIKASDINNIVPSTDGRLMYKYSPNHNPVPLDLYAAITSQPNKYSFNPNTGMVISNSKNRTAPISTLKVSDTDGKQLHDGKQIFEVYSYYDFLDKFQESIEASRSEISPRNMYQLYLIGKLNNLIK